MYLTDEELCMIEQLTYLDEAVAEKAGVSNEFGKICRDHIGKSIGEILEFFDDEALLRLAAHSESVCDGAISGVEWVQIISYLKNENNRISQLKLVDLYTSDNYYNAAVWDDEQQKYIGIADKDVYVYELNEYLPAAEYKRIHKVNSIPLERMLIKDPNTGEYVSYTSYLRAAIERAVYHVQHQEEDEDLEEDLDDHFEETDDFQLSFQ